MKPTLMMYIDGNNFYKNIAKLYGVKNVYPNWKSLILGIRDLIQEDHDCYFKKAFFFSALSERADNPEKYDGHKKFLDKLNECKYIDVVLGQLRRVPANEGIPVDRSKPSTYKHVEKKTDVNMSNEMLVSGADIVAILSADGDFEDTLSRLKKMGKTIIAIAPIGSKSIQMSKMVGEENMIYLSYQFLNRYVKTKSDLPHAS